MYLAYSRRLPGRQAARTSQQQAAGSGQAAGKKAFGRIGLGGFGCSASLEKRAGGSWQLAAGRQDRISNCECRMAKLTDSMTQELKRLNGRREGAAGRRQSPGGSRQLAANRGQAGRGQRADKIELRISNCEFRMSSLRNSMTQETRAGGAGRRQRAEGSRQRTRESGRDTRAIADFGLRIGGERREPGAESRGMEG